MKELKRYSDISHAHTVIIDNYNEFTNTVNIVERIDFLPIYRVFKRNNPRESPKVIHERYFQRSEDAFKYWSELMREKMELF